MSKAKKQQPTQVQDALLEQHAVTLERAEELRTLAGLQPGEGPPSSRIRLAIDVYVGQFDKWYGKQLRQILGGYEKLIRRINPYVRRAQFPDDTTAAALAEAVVSSWDSRNFVTAGGQALEALAIAIGPHCQKAIGVGLDIQRVTADDPTTLHLYVLKSGAITRNSDILAKMKQNVRKAEQLAQQNPSIRMVKLNYAVAAGAYTTTFSDSVHRPSSRAFWAQVMELPEDKALSLLWLATNEAAQSIKAIELNRRALVEQVATYIAKEDGSGEVDWPFLLRVANEPWRSYREEHKRRDALARAAGALILAGGLQA